MEVSFFNQPSTWRFKTGFILDATFSKGVPINQVDQHK